MNATTPNRQFAAKDARREHVPLLIGLTGPSGGGKTFSALRLATGIQQVTGGDIYFIDTESRRALHYADRFKFKHVPFGAPFGSLDYLAALKFCVDQGAKVVIVDSMSHEHEGPGGMVDLHDQIALRMSGGDAAKLERVKMLAWSEPKQKRRALINGILQLNANFIFCFRAKNTSKPVKGKNGRTEVEAMGFMPIAGEEFVFEQTLNALLMPGAGGVPTWFSEQVGERTMIKLPEQFADLRDFNGPLDEKIGKKLALWAQGTTTGTGGGEGRRDDASEDAASKWASAYIAKLADFTGIEALQAFADQKAAKLTELEAARPELHEKVTEALATRTADLKAPAQGFDDDDLVGADDASPGSDSGAVHKERADAIINEINAAPSDKDVTTIVSRAQLDTATLPDEQVVRVEIAADKRRNAIRKEQEAAKAKESVE